MGEECRHENVQIIASLDHFGEYDPIDVVCLDCGKSITQTEFESVKQDNRKYAETSSDSDIQHHTQ